MKKFLTAIIITITASLFSVSSLNFVFANNENLNNNFNINQIEINNQSDFLNVYGIQKFAVIGNNVAYAVNNKLFGYNLTTHQNIELSYDNVSNLENTSKYIFLSINNEIKILNATFQEVIIRGFNVTATNFNVFEKDGLTYISYINGSNMGFITINENEEITIDRNFDIAISNVITTALNEKYTYIVYAKDAANKLVKIDNTTQEKTEILFTYLNCNILDIAKINDIEYLLLTSSGNSTFTILTEKNNALTKLNVVLVASSVTPSFMVGDIANFTDVKVINNKIYVADNINGTIQNFILDNNNLTIPQVVIASAGYELGRFNQVRNLQIPSEKELYVTDTNNNRIQLIDNDENSVLTQINNTNFVQPEKFITADNINFFLQFNNQVTCINKTGTKHYTIFENGLIDITVNNNNELYALTTTKILKANNVTFETKLTSNFNVNSKLILLNNGYFAVSVDNNIMFYNENFELAQTLNLNSNALALESDYYNNVYVLTNSGIVKLVNNSETSEFEITTGFNKVDFSNITCFALNKVNGNFVLYDSFNSKLLLLECDYANNLKNFEHNTNVHELSTYETIFKTGKVISANYITTYPNSVNYDKLLNINDNVYIIDESLPDYFYCLYVNNNLTKFGYIKKSNLEININDSSETKQVETIYKNVKVYKLPTILKDESDYSFIVTTFTQNKILTAVNTELLSLDNSKYYAILLEDNTIGYVNSSDVRFYDNSDIKPLPSSNAKIYSEIGNIKLYTSDSVGSNVIMELKNNYKIYVEKFNEEKEFTQVTYVDENKVAHTGYVETKHIIMTSNNARYNSAYILIIASVIFIIAGLVIYFKQKKND